MKNICLVLAVLAFASGTRCLAKEKPGKHLFILSGQSNMVGLKPKISFVPTVHEAFGKNNVIIVKSANSGQPIRRWYKNWKPANGTQPEKNGDLYDVLIKKVDKAIQGHQLATVTFIWMQGESDARDKHASVYAESLLGLVEQLSEDLEREDLNVVIGRISDFDMDNKRFLDWTKIREIQVKVAEANPRFVWVDTDDLNEGKNHKGNEIKNDLHYSVEGYKELGRRFAEKSITLINAQQDSSRAASSITD